jgi:hypothetical protein
VSCFKQPACIHDAMRFVHSDIDRVSVALKSDVDVEASGILSMLNDIWQ